MSDIVWIFYPTQSTQYYSKNLSPYFEFFYSLLGYFWCNVWIIQSNFKFGECKRVANIAALHLIQSLINMVGDGTWSVRSLRDTRRGPRWGSLPCRFIWSLLNTFTLTFTLAGSPSKHGVCVGRRGGVCLEGWRRFWGRLRRGGCAADRGEK